MVKQIFCLIRTWTAKVLELSRMKRNSEKPWRVLHTEKYYAQDRRKYVKCWNQTSEAAKTATKLINYDRTRHWAFTPSIFSLTLLFSRSLRRHFLGYVPASFDKLFRIDRATSTSVSGKAFTFFFSLFFFSLSTCNPPDIRRIVECNVRPYTCGPL